MAKKRFLLKKLAKVFQAYVFPYNQGQGSGDHHMQGQLNAESVPAEFFIIVRGCLYPLPRPSILFDSYALRRKLMLY
jgi:hypothetical protein